MSVIGIWRFRSEGRPQILDGPDVCDSTTIEDLEDLFRLASSHRLTRRCERCLCWCLAVDPAAPALCVQCRQKGRDRCDAWES